MSEVPLYQARAAEEQRQAILREASATAMRESQVKNTHQFDQSCARAR